MIYGYHSLRRKELALDGNGNNIADCNNKFFFRITRMVAATSTFESHLQSVKATSQYRSSTAEKCRVSRGGIVS